MTDIFTSQNFPHIAAHCSHHSVQIQLGEFKNQYTASAFIVHSEGKKKNRAKQPKRYPGLDVFGFCVIFPQPQRELITGILGALMASPPWCSLSEVHPAISSGLAVGCSWASFSGANPGRTQFLGAVKPISELSQSLLQPQSLLCIPAMRRYMHHYRSCLYLCEVIEFYWEI